MLLSTRVLDSQPGADSLHAAVWVDISATDGTCPIGTQSFQIQYGPDMNAALADAIRDLWNINNLPGSPIASSDICLCGAFTT